MYFTERLLARGGKRLSSEREDTANLQNARALGVAIATAQHAENPADAAEARGCAPNQIKGNINDEDERIYHVPGSRWYDETRIDRAKGERCFDTVEQAERAGWRAPKG